VEKVDESIGVGHSVSWKERKKDDGKARRIRQERVVDVAWGSFSRSRLPSPGTRSARIFLLASAEDQTSHFISDDPFNPYPSLRHPRSTSLRPAFYPTAAPIAPRFLPQRHPPALLTSPRAMVDHV